MSEYMKEYIEFCEDMKIQPNKRDQIIFLAGYESRGFEEMEKRKKETKMKKLQMKDICTKETLNRSFPEHEQLDSENGCYSNLCRECGLEFLAHKYYSGICKECLNKKNNKN